MKEDKYHFVVHVVNAILLGFICFFLMIASFTVSTPVDDPVTNTFHDFSIGFMFVLWAISYLLQYKSRKKKWYVPFVGVVLYVAIVLIVLGYVIPFIGELLFPAY